jgi:hypothetical protein
MSEWSARPLSAKLCIGAERRIDMHLVLFTTPSALPAGLAALHTPHFPKRVVAAEACIDQATPRPCKTSGTTSSLS